MSSATGRTGRSCRSPARSTAISTNQPATVPSVPSQIDPEPDQQQHADDRREPPSRRTTSGDGSTRPSSRRASVRALGLPWRQRSKHSACNTSMSSWSARGSPGSVPRTTCRPNCPGRTYAILEGRPDIGGTWDLFRYPGVRSDSDMHTLGYSFKPWKAAKSIADGPSILDVPPRDRGRVRDRPTHPLRPPGRAAEWSTDDARWTVTGTAGDTGETRRVHVQLPVHVFGLLQLQGRLHAGVPGHRELRRAGRAPAGVAGGSRLRRQAGRRDRLRRHGRHARAGDGRRGRARHDAPALADLRGLPTGRGRDRQHAAQGAARRRSPTTSPGSRTRRCSR